LMIISRKRPKRRSAAAVRITGTKNAE
jgi:hypothetical protein